MKNSNESHVFRLFGAKEGGGWHLSDEECFQALKVLRLKEHDIIEVGDGYGSWCLGKIFDIRGKGFKVDVLEEHHVERYQPWANLCLGALKPQALKECLPQLVELGFDHLHLFWQEGTAHQRISDKLSLKLKKIAVEAFKVSKGAYLPEISLHGTITEMMEALDSTQGDRLICLPSGEKGLGHDPFGSEVTVAVGGEIGFRDREIELFHEFGFTSVHLGAGILRAKTAAACALSIIRAGRKEG